MINRPELKSRAKAILKTKYWMLLCAAFLLQFSTSYGLSISGNTDGNIRIGFGPYSYSVTAITTIMVLAAVGIVILLRLLLYPMEYGCANYFRKAHFNTEKGQMFSGYTENNFKRSIVILFMRDLFIFLWTLLLVVPGVMKAYSYRFVTYIIDENPALSYQEALKKSEAMTYGHRWDMFVLDISFIGWYILAGVVNIFTFGIGGYFLMPYVFQTDAELYLELKHQEMTGKTGETYNDD